MGQGRTAGQGIPGECIGAEGASQGRGLLFDQGVGGGKGADQGHHLLGPSLSLQQGAGEGHPLRLVMGLAKAGMQPAHPRPAAMAQQGIGPTGMAGDGGGIRL